MMNSIHSDFLYLTNSHRKVGVLFLIFYLRYYNRGCMKKIFSSVAILYCCTFSFSHAYSSDDAARANLIAQAGLIVSHEDIGSFRLDDSMLRQELIGTALKLA